MRKDEKLGKNGIYYLATPCIETSLSYNTCVQDMLFQSWGNKIRVFPALPDEWQDVAFHDFRTEGAFLISASRKEGVTSFVRIKSLAGEPCMIQPAMQGKPEIWNPEGRELKEIGEGCYQIPLKKGEEVTTISRGSQTRPNHKPCSNGWKSLKPFWHSLGKSWNLFDQFLKSYFKNSYY